jgi:hypothetical protein
VKLTTRMLKESTDRSALGKAEALCRSMPALMPNKDVPQHANPAYWARFVVGEGGEIR